MRALKEIGKTFVGLATIAALVLAYFAWRNPVPTPAEPQTKTTVTTFNPAGYVPEPPIIYQAVCTDASAVSPRPDARSCVASFMLWDPCFVLSDTQVLCPVPGKASDGAAAMTVMQLIDITIDPPWVQQTIDELLATGLPWAVRIEGEDEWCIMRNWFTQDAVFGDQSVPRYFCNEPYHHLIGNPVDFFANGNTILVEAPSIPGDIRIVRSLERSDDGRWAAQYVTNDGSLSRSVYLSDVEF